MDTFQFSDSVQHGDCRRRYRFVLQIVFPYHSVTSFSFIYARRLYRRRSFGCCRNFCTSRYMTGSVVNAPPLAQDPPGDTSETVIIASSPLAEFLKVRDFWLELSSASPALIYSVTITVE
jgi:hypothetical protein